MRTFRLDKLVRDKLVLMMQEMGQAVKYRVLDDEEYQQALQDKLVEETSEFNFKSPTALDELADLKAVIDQAAVELGSSPEELQKLQDKKAANKGGFADKLFVETVSMPDDDPWAAYYAAEPERFPEVLSNTSGTT